MQEGGCDPAPGREVDIQRACIDQEAWGGQAVKNCGLAKREQMTQRKTPCRQDEDAARSRDKERLKKIFLNTHTQVSGRQTHTDSFSRVFIQPTPHAQ